MSELLALSHVLSKPRAEMTPLEEAVVVFSAIDEDLANEAAQELKELHSKIEQNFSNREQFFLKLCEIVGLSYEDTDEEDLFAKLRTLAACYKIFSFNKDSE